MKFLKSLNIVYQSGGYLIFSIKYQSGYSIFNLGYQSGGYLIFKCEYHSVDIQKLDLKKFEYRISIWWIFNIQ